MRRPCCSSVFLGLLVLVIGCSNPRSSSSTGSTGAAKNDGQDKPRIALIMKSLANEFFSTMAKGAEQHHSKFADRYDLVVNGIKDERDLSRQVALVEEMVASGVDAIVIAPADSKALVPALRRARDAGVIVVNIDNRLDADVLKQENIQIPFVGPDNQAGAKKVADYLAAKLTPGDAVAMLEGIRTSFNATQRREGFEQAMQEAGIRIVDSQSAEWEMSKANTIASSMLSEHPEIKAILAAQRQHGPRCARRRQERRTRRGSADRGFRQHHGDSRSHSRRPGIGDRRSIRRSVGGVRNRSRTPTPRRSPCCDRKHRNTR